MRFLLLLLVVAGVMVAAKDESLQQRLLQTVLSAIETHVKGGIIPSDALEALKLSPTCGACHKVAKALEFIPAKETIKVLQEIAVEYCVLKKLQDRIVCKGAIGAMTKYILTGLWQKFTDPHSFCHRIRLCPQEYITLTADDYAKSILHDKPNKTQEEPTARKTLNIMHISDLHPDFFYTEGTFTECTEPICCRPGVTAKNGSTTLAGYWGSNKGDCDLPFHTLNLFLEEISHKDIDAIIWTGDNTAHDIWRQSQEYNANFTTIIAERFKEVLPHVKVFPAMGNHQSFPVNVYQFGKQDYLNTLLATAWAPWIGSEATRMMSEKGYFTFRVPEYKLVLLSINTQAWNDQNWMLVSDPTDPGGMLEWMESVLRKAEADGDKVYITGHIPPNEAMIEWSLRYNALVDRFNYVIRGQFYGHTHNDHLAFFSPLNDTTESIHNSYFVAPSLTTYSNKNPRYRIMKVDLDTMRVVDYDQFSLRLENNYTKEDRPKFQVSYSFLKEYNLSSMSFKNLQVFRARLRDNSQTQIKYTFHKYAQLQPGHASKTIHCQTFSTQDAVKKCESGSFKPDLFDKVAGSWRKLVPHN